MRKILNRFLLLFTIVFLYTNNVGAEIWVVDSISLDSSTDNSLEISWSEVWGAFWYYVYYSETPIVGDSYDDPIAEFIETNNYVISDLDKLTKYYISIKVVDVNSDESEWPFSDEVSFITKWASSLWSTFWLSNVRIEKLDKLVLVFTSPLDNSENADRDFKIVQRTDSSNYIYVSSTEVQNSTELLLGLESELIIWEQYDLTVITISSETWENIESWVNSLKSFIVPESFRPVVEPILIQKNPLCYSLILWDTTWDAPFETSVWCEWNDVDTFRIECGNGSVITKTANWLTNYIWSCNYDVWWNYQVICYINGNITNDSCKDSIQIYSSVVVEDNPIVKDPISEPIIEPIIEPVKEPIKNPIAEPVEAPIKNQWNTIWEPAVWTPKVDCWKSWCNNNLGNSTEVVAWELEELAKAWPESIIIFLISLLFALFLMISLRGKKS